MPDVELNSFISVDVETAGPNPGNYSLLSIGACLIVDSQREFYVELQPINDKLTPEAYAVHGLSLEVLAQHGLPPPEAMARFARWLKEVIPAGEKPIFVALNAPFDWMFINDYFHRYLGYNPFGYAALDIKAYFMGMSGVSWRQSTQKVIAARYQFDRRLTHHALRDAQDQAELFRLMLEDRNK